MMDYTSTNSGGGYMDTSFDGSSSNTTGYTRVSLEKFCAKHCAFKKKIEKKKSNVATETNG